VALSYGVDDVHGTVTEEHIYHSTGADTPEALPVEELRTLIKGAGRTPVERDAFYRELKGAPA
jgi:aminodeoxyfutalosine synthase